MAFDCTSASCTFFVFTLFISIVRLSILGYWSLGVLKEQVSRLFGKGIGIGRRVH
jgi:hypothetical protein